VANGRVDGTWGTQPRPGVILGRLSLASLPPKSFGKARHVILVNISANIKSRTNSKRDNRIFPFSTPTQKAVLSFCGCQKWTLSA